MSVVISTRSPERAKPRAPPSAPRARALAVSPATALPSIVQAKLRIGAPNDESEQNADRVADQVARMPDPSQSGLPGVIGRAADTTIERCEQEIQCRPAAEAKRLRAKPASAHPPELTMDLQTRIASLQHGGRPLPDAERAYFEPRFRQDFGIVRIHTDCPAADSTHNSGTRLYYWPRHCLWQRPVCAGHGQRQTVVGARVGACRATTCGPQPV
jgi:hypothetical protein